MLFSFSLFINSYSLIFSDIFHFIFTNITLLSPINILSRIFTKYCLQIGVTMSMCTLVHYSAASDQSKNKISFVSNLKGLLLNFSHFIYLILIFHGNSTSLLKVCNHYC